MKRHSHLHLCNVVVRLAPGDHDTEGATKQWEDVFGVQRSNTEAHLAFTNATMTFMPGKADKREGIESITIGVQGKGRLESIFQRAKYEGLRITDNGIEMLGILWQFIPLGVNESRARL